MSHTKENWYTLTANAADELLDLQAQLLELVNQVNDVVNGLPVGAVNVAAWKAYGYPQILQGIGNESPYVGESMCSIETLILELEEGY